MGKLANPCAKNDIINRLSTGESSNRIANDYDVSGQRIRQIKKENRELIEQKALNLSDYAHNPSTIPNETIYQTPEQIESFLNRQDKAGLKISQGTGILYPQSLNQINFNDNRQQTVISSAFQAFLDWEAKHTQPIDTQGDIESDDN